MSDYVINNPNTKLRDFIHVERAIIPDNLCDYILEDIEKREWTAHSWYSNVTDSFSSEEAMELDVQSITPELQKLLTPVMKQACALYNQKYAYPCEKTLKLISKFSAIRFNRYRSGQIMRQHQDHIHSLFDGNQKGIPVLSFILNLNDDYEGAELYFWENHIVKLGKGDIIIFPSLFLFPHGVKEATKGTRYSAVSWAW